MTHEHETNVRTMKELEKNIKDLNFQGDGFDRNQTRLTRERQRLSAWRGKVAGLETALENLAGQFENAPQPSGSATSPALKQKYLSRLFHKEVQGKLCTADRQAAVVKSLQTQHKLMLLHLDDAFAVVELLQAQVVDAACNDPASLILPHLVIPLLRDRMEALERDPEGGAAVWGGGWDPMWPRDVLATQYRQKPVNISCEEDMTLQLLLLHLEGFVQMLGLLGITDTHVTFVDDLLFPKDHILQSAVFGAEILLNFLGCYRCMATLLFFS